MYFLSTEGSQNNFCEHNWINKRLTEAAFAHAQKEVDKPNSYMSNTIFKEKVLSFHTPKATLEAHLTNRDKSQRTGFKNFTN